MGNEGGAPERNKNAWKHGAYSKVIADSLDEEENVIFERSFDEEESQLIEQIRLLDVSIIRKLKAIQQYREFLITTAGRDKNSICYKLHQKACAILEGTKHDPSFYPVVYG